MSSGFVTETELQEAKQKRQDEWEKVRQPSDPVELPEEPYDSRSLYHRLKEQKDKKDLEFEEAHKLKNLIRGLDDDEVQFLDVIDRAKMNAELKQQMEEKNELQEFRERVANLHEKSLTEKIHAEVGTNKSKPKMGTLQNRPSQKSILSGIVRKRKASESNTDIDKSSPNKQSNTIEQNVDVPTQSNGLTIDNKSIDLTPYNEGALKCIGILPGIGPYTDSDRSSDSDDDSTYDWLGRIVKKKCVEEVAN